MDSIKPSMSRKYTPAQKLAYYKKLAKGNATTVSRRRYSKRAPMSGRVRGYGAYTKDYGKRLGSVVGEGLQEALTQLNPIGAIKKVIGFGDYVAPGFDVIENSLMSMGNDPPEIFNAKDGRFIVRHREYLQDVITGAAGAFKVSAYPIQPGLETTFPWLAQVAQAFGQYKMRGMIFEFKSSSADALSSTNTALGTVVMATEYNAALPLFTDKQEMENHQYATSARQSSSIFHPIECARDASVSQQLYTRTGAVPAGEDPRLYDFGNFQIATVGQQAANVNIGELWVTYEIELLKPQINEVGSVQNANYYQNIDLSGTGITATPRPFGPEATMEASTENSIEGLQFPTLTGSGTYSGCRWPIGSRGSYLIVVNWQGTSITNFGGFFAGNDGVTFSETPFAALQSTSGGTSYVAVCMVTLKGQSSAGAAPLVYLETAAMTMTAVTSARFYVAAVRDGMDPSTIQPIFAIEELPEWVEFKKKQDAQRLREFLEYKKEKEHKESFETPITDQLSESTNAKLAAYLAAKRI